ncbi:hypothetical protein [Embleya sp. NBC_00896]|nr:hypothetical protein OG928_32535 [Embleya sp. NBC_00896]
MASGAGTVFAVAGAVVGGVPVLILIAYGYSRNRRRRAYVG